MGKKKSKQLDKELKNCVRVLGQTANLAESEGYSIMARILRKTALETLKMIKG